MRKLLYLVLLVGAGYYAYSHVPEQADPAPMQADFQPPAPAQTKAHNSQAKNSRDPESHDQRATESQATRPQASGSSGSETQDVISRAYERRQTDVPVQAAGVVAKILGDDNEGSRHQRFLVRLASGQTILIAHNIDLASRVAPLAVGDRVEFSGEYAWNNKGGVVHWTHRDPSNRHQAGWVKHNGATFQ